MDRTNAQGGYTLVELMIGMTLASMIMLAVLGSYLYMGRNSARLSYQHALEVEARTITNNFALDVRNAKTISSASSTGLTVVLVSGTTVTYAYTGSDLTRTPILAGRPTSSLTYDIVGEKVQVPVTMTACTFSFYTTADGDPTSQYNPPYLVPLSIKQASLNFTLRAGNSGAGGQVGTMTSFQIASGWLLFRNKQLPDGN